MRFDSTPYYHVGEDYSWQTLIHEMREEVRLMDQGGFTGLWLAEHHFAWDGWYRAPTDPILVGADLIAESDRMRVGQCGTIIPDWNPIRVAEDIAILDQLTKGRVDFGAGRGINTRSTIQFFKEADRRDPERNRALFREALEIIVRALENDAFSYKGEFYTYPMGEFYTYPTPGWYESNPLVRDPRYHADDGELIALGVTTWLV
jgi:alkanesulfonate monooxygenase SsuD/methylene tetrahydromethanopterin reductase-like flavin-dependent oxidoreductase (luciferase family)